MFLVFTCWHTLRKTFSFSRLYFCFAILRLSGVYSPTENLRWAHEFVQSCQNPEDRGSGYDNFFLTFLLLLARSEDRELLACLLCMISSTWNLPGFGGTSISLNWKQSKVRSPNFWVTECSVFQKKGNRRKERGSALPRLHGTHSPCDLLDLTFCEKTKEK